MNDRIWNSGPPPHVGWWNAGWSRCYETWRWWDGKVWSRGITPFHPSEDIAHSASMPTNSMNKICWTDYWPENAPVPRVDPCIEPKFVPNPSFVHTVPDHCDRIIWRGRYYSLTPSGMRI